MIELLQFEDEKAKFENLDIYIYTIRVERYNALESNEKPVAYTNVWEDLKFHFFNDYLNMVGMICVAMRNNTEEDNTVLFLTLNVRVNASNEFDKANVFTKTLQFIFEWAEKSAKEGKIKNAKGDIFIVPHFLYSRHYFEKHF